MKKIDLEALLVVLLKPFVLTEFPLEIRECQEEEAAVNLGAAV